MPRLKGSKDKKKFLVEVQGICIGCKESFQRIVGNKNPHFTKYCSIKCRIRSQSLRRYNTTQSEVNSILKNQNYKCAICKEELTIKNINVDHSHETGGVRGILCSPCNMGLGSLRDNVDNLKSAIIYLEK